MFKFDKNNYNRQITILDKNIQKTVPYFTNLKGYYTFQNIFDIY